MRVRGILSRDILLSCTAVAVLFLLFWMLRSFYFVMEPENNPLSELIRKENDPSRLDSLLESRRKGFVALDSLKTLIDRVNQLDRKNPIIKPNYDDPNRITISSVQGDCGKYYSAMFFENEERGTNAEYKVVTFGGKKFVEIEYIIIPSMLDYIYTNTTK